MLKNAVTITHGGVTSTLPPVMCAGETNVPNVILRENVQAKALPLPTSSVKRR